MCRLVCFCANVLSTTLINQVFLTKSAGMNYWFPVNIMSLLWPIYVKFIIYVAYIKRKLRIAIQVSVIKVKVAVAKNRKSYSEFA